MDSKSENYMFAVFVGSKIRLYTYLEILDGFVSEIFDGKGE